MSEPTAWKRHCPDFAWPTAVLGALLPVASVVILRAEGAMIGAWAAFGAQTMVAYLAFTVAHEAAHGNVHGRHPKLAFIDDLLGWIAAALLAAPFSAFRVIHLHHHSETNVPERDPDYWVRGSNPLSIALRCLTIVPHYYYHFLFGPTRHLKAARKARASTIGGLVLLFVVCGIAMQGGWLASLLAFWLGPAILASGVLAFFFDWVPHTPHSRRGRFVDTRVIVFPGFGLLTLGQAYHLMHHLFPKIPFYRYAAIFQETRPELETRGAEIWDWHKRG